jgi:hypothetical protein
VKDTFLERTKGDVLSLQIDLKIKISAKGSVAIPTKILN